MRSVKNTAQLAEIGSKKPVETVVKEPAQNNQPLLAAAKALSDAADQVVTSNQRLVERVVQALQRPEKVDVPAPKRWVFTVERDHNDLMTRIIADAEE